MYMDIGPYIHMYTHVYTYMCMCAPYARLLAPTTLSGLCPARLPPGNSSGAYPLRQCAPLSPWPIAPLVSAPKVRPKERLRPAPSPAGLEYSQYPTSPPPLRVSTQSTRTAAQRASAVHAPSRACRSCARGSASHPAKRRARPPAVRRAAPVRADPSGCAARWPSFLPRGRYVTLRARPLRAAALPRGRGPDRPTDRGRQAVHAVRRRCYSYAAQY
jgi:hypothetical protein